MKLEKGKDKLGKRVFDRLRVGKLNRWNSTLKDHERCYIMRRQAGYTQGEVAKEMKCCRRWVNLMERGLAPVDDLIWYWEA